MISSSVLFLLLCLYFSYSCVCSSDCKPDAIIIKDTCKCLSNMDSFYIMSISFYIFLLPIALSRASSILWNSNGKSDILILYLTDLRERAFSFLPLSTMLAVVLSYITYYVKVYCFCSHLTKKGFYHKWMLNCFLCIYWHNFFPYFC